MSKLGLWKKCPGCGRMGEVFLSTVEGFDVVWDPRNNPLFVERLHDREARLLLGTLMDPDFGCGHDQPRTRIVEVRVVPDEAPFIPQRIVACVNACEGIPTAALDIVGNGGVLAWFEFYDSMVDDLKRWVTAHEDQQTERDFKGP